MDSREGEKSYIIDRKVISELVRKSLSEIEGIHGVKRSLWRKGIRVKFLGEGIVISLELIIKEGNPVPELMEETQKKVKEEVEKVLEESVAKVNVRIRGIKHA